MRIRVVFDILFFLGVFTLPIWLVCPTAVVFLFLFENFYEIIFAAILIDALYGLPTRFFPMPAVYTIPASVLFLSGSFLKKHLRFYV